MTSDRLPRPDAPSATAPPPASDFYDFAGLLAPGERGVIERLRAFCDEHVRPIINEHWARATFPHEVVAPMRALGIAGIGHDGHGCPGGSSLLAGFVSMELARVDVSLSTFYGVHSGLAMGSIIQCGSEEQKRRWLPAMARMDVIGAFGLTEPEVGSGIAGGLATTARRDGDHWVLDGEKKWIGNATFADLTVIWARDESDGQVKGFLVEKGTPGFETVKIEGKMALRVVQNALITLTGCRVPEANRLQEDRSFKDTAEVLRLTRAGVAWQAVGCAMGAYDHALHYAKERRQFGRPIASFQLVQDLLARMLGNITASLAMVHRLSQMQDEGTMRDEHASLAKMFCTVRMRETVGHARELLGGNGILLEHGVAKFVADAEAVYSYEGTREINALIVGRAITGESAFV